MKGKHKCFSISPIRYPQLIYLVFMFQSTWKVHDLCFVIGPWPGTATRVIVHGRELLRYVMSVAAYIVASRCNEICEAKALAKEPKSLLVVIKLLRCVSVIFFSLPLNTALMRGYINPFTAESDFII